MSKEVATILVNGLIAAIVVALIGLGRCSVETGVLVLGSLAVPSVFPGLIKKMRNGKEPPSSGPSVMLLLLGMGFAVTPTSCAPPAAPESPPRPAYCFDEKAFGDELVKCAATKPTKEDSHACRAAVHSKCGYKTPETGDAR